MKAFLSGAFLGVVASVIACASSNANPAGNPSETATVAPANSAAPSVATGTTTGAASAATSARASAIASSPPPPTSASASEPGTCEGDVTKLRGKFRRCYNTGLATDPKMEGREIVLATVDDESGVVTDAKVETNAGLSASVAECIRAVVAAGPLHCGAGASHQVRVPVVFRLPTASSATP